MTRRSSKAGTRRWPLRAAWARAVARQSAIVSPPNSTSAPAARAASSRLWSTPSGMNSSDRSPRPAAAMVTARAWLPADAATTVVGSPSERVVGSDAMWWWAPRILHDPDR